MNVNQDYRWFVIFKHWKQKQNKWTNELWKQHARVLNFRSFYTFKITPCEVGMKITIIALQTCRGATTASNELQEQLRVQQQSKVDTRDVKIKLTMMTLKFVLQLIIVFFCCFLLNFCFFLIQQKLVVDSFSFSLLMKQV